MNSTVLVTDGILNKISFYYNFKTIIVLISMRVLNVNLGLCHNWELYKNSW